MNDPLILYSVNSYFAYYINEKYYKKHFVWCCPKYNTNDENLLNRNNPRSSNPKFLIDDYLTGIKTAKTFHVITEFLKERINGLNYGLYVMKSAIGDDNFNIISKMLDDIKNNYKFEYFFPIIYVMPYKDVRKKVIEAPVHSRADTLSEEYNIENLQSNEFDPVTPSQSIKYSNFIKHKMKLL
jgi:hypothetical protein